MGTQKIKKKRKCQRFHTPPHTHTHDPTRTGAWFHLHSRLILYRRESGSLLLLFSYRRSKRRLFSQHPALREEVCFCHFPFTPSPHQAGLSGPQGIIWYIYQGLCSIQTVRVPDNLLAQWCSNNTTSACSNSGRTLSFKGILGYTPRARKQQSSGCVWIKMTVNCIQSH